MQELIKLGGTIIFWVAVVMMLLYLMLGGVWLLLGYAFTGSEVKKRASILSHRNDD